ncbi:MAG: hypothetical protein Q9225_006744 [Loekoesia sp. 1 TL-2023]
MATPAPTPGAKCWAPAPVAGVAAAAAEGDAAVEPIIVDPRPRKSAQSSVGNARTATDMRKREVAPRTTHGARRAVEEPIIVEGPVFPEDVPVLLEDPPLLAPVVLSPGHVAAVGSFTLALHDNN